MIDKKIIYVARIFLILLQAEKRSRKWARALLGPYYHAVLCSQLHLPDDAVLNCIRVHFIDRHTHTYIESRRFVRG